MRDTIYRDDVIKAIDDAFENIPMEQTTEILKVRRAIRTMPSADRPQGEWLPFEFGDERWHKCSCCGTADRYIEYAPRPNGTVGKLVSIRNYCPNCGARMKGADDE